MNSSIKPIMELVLADGESISTHQLDRRMLQARKKLLLHIPEPQRNDIERKFNPLLDSGQLYLAMYYEAAPQPELPLDEHHAQPIQDALVNEVQTLAGRIESSMTDIYARIEDTAAPPLTDRQDALLREFGGKAQRLNLVTGPQNLHIPYGPGPMVAESKVYYAQVCSHQPHRLELQKVLEESEGGKSSPVRAKKNRLSLLLDRADFDEQARLHRHVAEIFVKGEPHRISFRASAKMSATSGVIVQLLFEQIVP